MTSIAKRLKYQHSSVWITIALLSLPPLFWAGNFIVGRSVRGEIPAISLSFFRWSIAALVLLPITYKTVTSEWGLYWQSRKLILLASVSGISAFNTLVYLGLQSTTANNAMILNAFIPLLISVIGMVFLGMRLNKRQWLGLFISLTGVLVIITYGDILSLFEFQFNKGDLTVFVAMFCWAIYTLTLKRLPSELNRLGLIMVQIFIGWVFLLPLYLNEVISGATIIWNQHLIFSLLYVGLIPSVLAYIVYSACVARLGAARAGLSTNLLPVFGILLSALFLGESMHAYQIAGMLMIFSGLFMSK